jgi:hypothetical protein
MLKPTLSVKELEEHAIGVLRELLDELPGITVELLERETLMDTEVDIIASVELAGQQYTLVCEVKKSGQPRFVRDAIHQLGDFAQCIAKPVTPVLIAPYLSNESRELCLQNKVSFLDFEGNARLTFGTVFIDRIRANKPAPERREFRSLFKPKSAQVLRVLLRCPEQSWKLVDLAEAAGVSLGHASNVRNRSSIENGLNSAEKDFASRHRAHYSMLGNLCMSRLSRKSFVFIRLSMGPFWRVTFECCSNLCPTAFK